MTQRVLTTRPALPGGGLDRLAAQSELVRWDGEGKPEPAELHALAAGASGILCLGNDRVDAALLDAAGPSLKVVGLASMGFDGVDREAAAERGVVVTHTPGVLAETTADLTFSLILMARRRLGAARDSLAAGRWDLFRMDDYLGLDIHGATLGLVGFGQIGRAVARRAQGFGMRVLHHDPFAPDDTQDPPSKAVDLPTLLAEADVVSLHVPLTPQTRHLIGAAELAAMKPTATLVSTSRGGVIDENALLHAVREGGIHRRAWTSTSASPWAPTCPPWSASRVWRRFRTSAPPPRPPGPPWSTSPSTTSSRCSLAARPPHPCPAARGCPASRPAPDYSGSTG